jgi:hypothetical protein
VTTVAELAAKVRVAAAVSSTYDGTVVTDAITRTMKRMLRDYNFPKSVRRQTWAGAAIGAQSYPVPAGLKRPLELRFTNPVDGTWSDELERKDGFVLPQVGDTERPYGRYYWIEGTNLYVDRPMPVGGLNLVLWHQSLVVDTESTTWLLDDFEDLIFSRACFLLTSELRKEELAPVFDARVQDEMTSIAIFANELEWQGMNMMMREANGPRGQRYPASL